MYLIRAMGGEADPRWAEAINQFWGEEVEVGPPLQQTYFGNKKDISSWAYQQYLDVYAVGGMPNLIAVVPKKFQSKTLYGAWGSETWDKYQVAVVSEMLPRAMSFSLIHEFGHLLYLSDHYWPLTCIMAWYPWWIIPLELRNVCSKCKKRLEEA